MKLRYASKKLQKTLQSEKQIQKAYGDRAGRLKRRLSILEAARTLADVPHDPPERRHRLNAPFKGCYGIDISGNWRIVLRPVAAAMGKESEIDLETIEEIEIVKIMDYH